MTDDLLEPNFFRGKECHTKQVLDWLDDDNRAKLQAALDNDRVEPAKICEWLKANGFPVVATEGLRRHRNRGSGKANRCSCP